MSRGGRISGNGRPAALGTHPYPRMYEENDMEAKIHQLEQEAYSSVLRAFKAQADSLTWVLFVYEFNVATCLIRFICLLNEMFFFFRRRRV